MELGLGADHRATFTACPPWCAPHDAAREDCLHMSQGEEVTLSRQPDAASLASSLSAGVIAVGVVQDRCSCADGDPAPGPRILMHAPPNVDGDVSSLTLAEAEQVADMLIRVIKQAKMGAVASAA